MLYGVVLVEFFIELNIVQKQISYFKTIFTILLLQLLL
jgi:hypothetical protein